MLEYLAKRLLIVVPTLFVIVTLAFFLMRAAPGGPFDGERRLPPDVEANLLRAYKLDLPLHEQYLNYLGMLLHGDLGPSFRQKDFTVNELIAAGFPVSLRVGALAMLMALLGGVAAGAWAGFHHHSRIDHVVMAAAMTGLALPPFVVGPLLALVFGVYLRWLPVAGWGGGALPNLLLPAIALGLPYLAAIARLTRGSMIEVLQSHYIRTARAKGLSETRVVLVHALPAAIVPVVSFLGPATTAVITGSVVIEQIFDLPGIGRYFVQGALARDYTLVMGVVIVYAGFIIALNLVIDLLYVKLDPRVSYQ